MSTWIHLLVLIQCDCWNDKSIFFSALGKIYFFPALKQKQRVEGERETSTSVPPICFVSKRKQLVVSTTNGF